MQVKYLDVLNSICESQNVIQHNIYLHKTQATHLHLCTTKWSLLLICLTKFVYINACNTEWRLEFLQQIMLKKTETAHTHRNNYDICVPQHCIYYRDSSIKGTDPVIETLVSSTVPWLKKKKTAINDAVKAPQAQ